MNKHTFYIDSRNKIHAYDGEYVKSKRGKIYAKRISRSTFLVSEDKNSEYILNFQEMIEYIIATINISNEIIITNLSRAIVGRMLSVCNENINIEKQEETTKNSQKKAIDIANDRLLELFGITYDEFVTLPCLEQNELMEQLYMNKEKTGDKKVMIGSGIHSMFITKQKGDRVMLDDGTFVRAGDNPYQRRNRLDDKLNDIVKEESFIKKLIKKIDRN